MPISLNSVNSGVIETVTLNIANTDTATYNLVIFSSAPSTTFSNKTAGAIVAADAPKQLCIISLANPQTVLGANATNYQVTGVDCRMVLGSASLWAQLVVASGTPTYASATGVALTIAGSKD
jgi:hypothetical protein